MGTGKGQVKRTRTKSTEVNIWRPEYIFSNPEELKKNKIYLSFNSNPDSKVVDDSFMVSSPFNFYLGEDKIMYTLEELEYVLTEGIRDGFYYGFFNLFPRGEASKQTQKEWNDFCNEINFSKINVKVANLSQEGLVRMSLYYENKTLAVDELKFNIVNNEVGVHRNLSVYQDILALFSYDLHKKIIGNSKYS